MAKHNGLLRRRQRKSRVEPAELSGKASERLRRLGEQASVLAQSVVEQAAERAVSGAERAREARSSLEDVAKDRGPHVSDVQHKVAEDVVPALRDVATQAASLALELWQTARERAQEAGESARHDLAPQASGVVDKAEKRAEGAAHAVAHRADETLSRTRKASKHAAHATADTGKDTGAMLFWAGAATGVILFALMGKERRDQVLRMASSSLAQIREIMQDFQGYDEEFGGTQASGGADSRA